jgi:hypothetical protein
MSLSIDDQRRESNGVTEVELKQDVIERRGKQLRIDG